MIAGSIMPSLGRSVGISPAGATTDTTLARPAPGRRVVDRIVENPAGNKAFRGPAAQSNVTTPRATWPVRSAAKPSLISSILYVRLTSSSTFSRFCM